MTNNLDLKKTALIFGAGAVANAWEPVNLALKQYCRISNSGSGASNFLLSRIVYDMRMSQKSFISEETRRAKAAEFKEIKESISKEIRKFHQLNKFEPRNDIIEISNLIKKNSTSIAALTTNWDKCIDEVLAKSLDLDYCTHIHGSYEDSSTLYLPSEIIHEEYRTENEISTLAQISIDSSRILAEANTIIIYGLSVSPLDVELSDVFFHSFNGSEIETVLIVNPNGKQVVENIQFTFGDGCERIDLFSCTTDELKHVSYSQLHRKRLMQRV